MIMKVLLDGLRDLAKAFHEMSDRPFATTDSNEIETVIVKALQPLSAPGVVKAVQALSAAGILQMIMKKKEYC